MNKKLPDYCYNIPDIASLDQARPFNEFYNLNLGSRFINLVGSDKIVPLLKEIGIFNTMKT